MKKTVMFILALSIIISVAGLSSMAAFNVETISNLTTTKIADIPDYPFENVSYTAMGGFGIGKLKNSMFVLKASSNEQMAAFYYFPEIDEPDRYGVYRLRYAGHANAMAVTDKYIYVTGWVSDNDNIGVGYQEHNVNNNWIIKVPRKTISAMGLTKTGQKIPKDDYDTEEEEGFSVMHPKVKTVNDDGTVTYSPYTRTIASITKYKSNTSFIIGYRVSGNYYGFTKAKIETYNNKKYFVVSENRADMFVVKNTMSLKSAIAQDIFYSEENGLFIPTWYGGEKNEANSYYNPAKNVVLWANIDSNSYTNVTIDKKTYKAYTPAKINLNMGSSTYRKFEMESLAFDVNNNLLFSANVWFANKTYESDAIYKLTRTDGLKFTIS